MLPTPCALLTVNMPLATSHLAGEWSWADTHSSRFFPSKRTIASEGGSALVAPGVTILGTGSQTSVSSGLGLPGSCATRKAVIEARNANARICENRMRIVTPSIHLGEEGIL